MSKIPNVSDEDYNSAVQQMVVVLDFERTEEWQNGRYDTAVQSMLHCIFTFVRDSDAQGDSPFGVGNIWNMLIHDAEDVLSIRSRFAGQALADRGWTRSGMYPNQLLTPAGELFPYRTVPVEVLTLIVDGWTYRDKYGPTT